jgi:hypothetical protein
MIAFLAAHWTEIIAIASAAHLLALAIINATPTPRDNEIYGKVYRVIEVIAGLITKVAKK